MGRYKRRNRKGCRAIWLRCDPRIYSVARGWDPEGEDTFLPPVDTEGEDTFLPPVDTEGEDTFLPPVDTEGEDTFLPPVDTEGEDTFLPPVDTEGERAFLSLDPTCGRRRQRLWNDVLCGDYPSGRAGNIRRSATPQLSGKIVVRLTPKFALATEKSLDELALNLELETLKSVLDTYELNDRSRRLVARRGSYEAYDEELGRREITESEDERLPPTDRIKTAEQSTVTDDYFDDDIEVPPEQEVIEFSAEPREVSPKEIVELEKTVADSPLAPLHSLASYWRLDATHKPGELVEMLEQLNSLVEVSLAYPEVAVTDPGNGMGDPFVGSQSYMDRAPFGIDARWARRHGGDGSDVALVDLEQGWIPDHAELGWKSPALIHGNNRHGREDYEGHHGTAVLGEIAAGDNRYGVVGIAPGVAKLGLTSHFHDEPDDASPPEPVPPSGSHIAEAIYAAIGYLPETATVKHEPFLKAGDVLLIEAQRGYLPTEVDPADFDAIRLASALGIIVVEAAGNGGRNLDRYSDNRGAIFNRRKGSYRESGAIMVGAALSALPHNRKRASNYGSRVDCYAWGTDVVTCGYGDLHSGGWDQTYTADFSNTSAAAPIIAGAALILQDMYQTAATPDGAQKMRRLSPGQMRALLADPATGTPQGRGVRGHIGVMPNLRAIVENTLGIVPDVYLRDGIGDTGAVPAARTCRSPDVFVTQEKGQFGEGSPKENDPGLGYKVAPGVDNLVYVRMSNRGRLATKMTATIYRSPAATLVTPDKWVEIGCCEEVTVPQGDTLAVPDPLVWKKDALPDPGFYCLIALAEDANDPKRLPPGLLAAEGARARAARGKVFEAPRFDWRAYLAFLRNHNHLALRNLHVIDDLKPGRETNKTVEFFITGTPEGDRGRFFDLEILQQLPTGAELCLDVPMTLAPALKASWQPETVVKDKRVRNRRVRVAYKRYCLPAIPRFPFCKVPLDAGAMHACDFVIRGYPQESVGGHEIAIRQLYRDYEVGRVTFLIRPEES